MISPRILPAAGRTRWWLPVLVCTAAAALAQTGQEVEQSVSAAVDVRRQTQQTQDLWADQRADLTQRFRDAQARVQWLEARKQAQAVRVEALEARVQEMDRRLTEADRLEASLQDTLQVIFGRLQATVDQGLPFLPEERRFRLETLSAELAQPDLAAADKLRRLLEALQVEAAYASTIEIYPDKIQVAGEILHADVLRLGRVALLWMTPDRKRAGVYDQGSGVWGESPGAQKRRIGLAMAMAARLRPIDLVALPLGRISLPEGVRP
jgi:hypothetical protein